MKTIGVLGGLGPQATIDFEVRLHQVAQQRIPQHGNEGYPPLVSYFFRESPVIMPADGSWPTSRPPLNPHLLDAARWLGTLVDFLVITSNGVYAAEAEIAQAAGRPILSMIDVVLDEVQRRGYQRVGVVDFRPSAIGVYPRRLEACGVAWEELPEDLQHEMVDIMLAVDEGRSGVAEERRLRVAIAALRSRGVDGIILACTEFPLALSAPLDADIINPAELLAEAAVCAALV